MEPITLREILQAVDGRLLGEDVPLETAVNRVDTDSRNIHPGSLFLPLVGERFDGHDYIRQALTDGAAGCLTDREPEDRIPGKFYIQVGGTQRALRDLARWYKSRFSIPFIAITGSVGKTTTRDMVAAVLGERYRVLKTQGNFNNQVGLPLTLLRLERSHEICVLEMGMNHTGEIDYLSAIVEPDVAVITNVGDAHIENLGSRKNILQAKCEIFHHMKPEGLAVLNGDDELLVTLRQTLKRPILWCGRDSACDFRAAHVESDGERLIHCKVTTPDSAFDLEIPALGHHMIYPALTALAIGRYFGLTEQEMVRGVRHFAPTKMRMNILRRGEGIVILDDAYNANPQSVRAALQVLADSRGKRKVAVLGDMLELGPLAPALHGGIGEFAAQSGVDCLVCVGELSRYIADAAGEGGMKEVYWRPNKKEALAVLEQVVKPDCTVLVKASRGMAFEEIVSFLKEHTSDGPPSGAQ
ncbi:MAG: UDP-N-acetylmuramoyl-tripeptide--D-alanyl-D-alanine ligase [Oscillospiraceae bacterium]|nr:UDP-N-acetylmuramoyl-tripeptide--D-alanyl-D-alanine ligase [Oscillospiraceae bacterium]